MAAEVIDRLVRPSTIVQAVPRELSRPPVLEDLAQSVRMTTIAYDTLIDELPAESTAGSLDGLMGEAFLRRVLHTVANDDPEGRIDVNPITPGQETPHFLFGETDRGTVVAFDKDAAVKDTGDVYAEIDALTRLTMPGETDARKITVVWEIKTGGRAPNGRSNADITSALRDHRVDKKLQPLQELFPTDHLGFVVVGLTGSLSRHSPALDNFRARRGIYVTLPETSERFHKNTQAVRSLIRAS